MEQSISSEQLMQDVYGRFWQHEKTHGPDAARTSLVRRIRDNIQGLAPEDYVLDLGAGRQSVERQLLRNWRKQISCQFVTLDIADIQQKKLLGRSKVSPVRGSGAHLPFKDGTFSTAISSMGLELMPTEAIPELARVLKPGGKAFINVLHPSVSSWKRDDLLKPRSRSKPMDKKYTDFWNHYAREDNVFGKGDETIRQVLCEFGFDVDRIETVDSNLTSWIEVDLTRNDTPYGETVEEFVNGLSGLSELRANEPYDVLADAFSVAQQQERRRDFFDNMNA